MVSSRFILKTVQNVSNQHYRKMTTTHAINPTSTNSNRITTTVANTPSWSLTDMWDKFQKGWTYGEVDEKIDILTSMEEWDICSDRQYGGRSKGKVRLHKNPSQDEPILTFEGILKTYKHADDVEEAEIGQVPGSFSCLKAEELNDSIDLMGYTGLEVVLTSNVTREYKLNLTSLCTWGNEIFQCTFLLQAGEKTTLHIPFENFRGVQKVKGIWSQYPVAIPDYLRVSRIAFLAAESVDTGDDAEQHQCSMLEKEFDVQSINKPFALDVFSVNALAELDGDLVYKRKKMVL